MAELKKSEARLLAMFGILIFAAITFFVLGNLKDKKNKMLTRQRVMKKEISELESLIKTQPKWEYRRDFVQRYQPVYRGEDIEAPALEAYIRRAAGSLEPKLLANRPLPMDGNMVTISYSVKASGSGSEILSFLSVLQSENRFYAIPSISISAARKDPAVVELNMLFERWFIDDGSFDQDEFPSTPEPIPAGTVAERPSTAPEKPKIVPPPAPASATPPGLITDPTAPTTTTQNENETIKPPVTPVVTTDDEADAESKTN